MGKEGAQALGGDKDSRPKLIVAAADTAQNGSPPSDLLQLALDCSQYNMLPRLAGVEEQEAGIIDKMRRLGNVYNSYYSMINTSLNQQKWSETNPQMWGIVGRTERLKVELLKNG